MENKPFGEPGSQHRFGNLRRRLGDSATLAVLVLTYLRANEFKTYIVSGGGADFMRVWSERVYGMVPEQVIGSHARTKFEVRDGKPVLVKTLDHLFVDDKEGKPVGIHQFIGRRPLMCFGNSDGDQAMLEYKTTSNPRPSFGLLVHVVCHCKIALSRHVVGENCNPSA